MGPFSWECKRCNLSIVGPGPEDDALDAFNLAVAVTPNGSILKGRYDGYGCVANWDMVDDEVDFYHQHCWEAEGRPMEFKGGSRPANDQGSPDPHQFREEYLSKFQDIGIPVPPAKDAYLDGTLGAETASIGEEKGLTPHETLFMYERVLDSLFPPMFTDREKEVFGSLLKKLPGCFEFVEVYEVYEYYKLTREGADLNELLMYGREFCEDLNR